MSHSAGEMKLALQPNYYTRSNINLAKRSTSSVVAITRRRQNSRHFQNKYYSHARIDNGFRYSERMKKLSQLFHDRPMSPVDTAVYWVEYVIRHKGAHHLRTAGSKMPWYQYYLLDVISLCLVVFCILLYAVGRIAAIIYICIHNTFFSRKLKTN